MWTKAQVAAHQRAIAAAEKHEPTIAKLEALAPYAPHLAERIKELRTRRDNLHHLASTAIAIDAQGN